MFPSVNMIKEYYNGFFYQQGTKVSKMGDLASRDVLLSGLTNFHTLVDDLATAVR
jgi:hypothetical protein